MRARTAILAAILSVLPGENHAFVAQQPPRILTVELTQTTRDFVLATNEYARFAKIRDGGSSVFEAQASDTAQAGFQLRYGSGACIVLLPPGRWVQVGQMAGRIVSLTAFMPMETLDFDAGIGMSEVIRASLTDATWIETSWTARPSKSSIGSNPFAPTELRLGEWNVCGDKRHTAILSIKDAGEAVVGTSIPATTQLRDAPVRPGGEYLLVLDMNVSDEESTVFGDLARARRQAVNGDKEKELMAKVWIDDPDWRPGTPAR